MISLHFSVALAAFLGLAACGSTLPRGRSTITVTTDRGPVVGLDRGALRVWRGIPYAAPPVGALRWQPPAPVAPWSAPRDAARFGHTCPQLADGKLDRDSDEDCLNVDIWSPRSPTKLPVMVWIHGGAFHQGTANDALYDGEKLALRARAVVVNMEYRLGALGFLALPELAREAGRPASPSYAILDQREALKWVQRNIAAFGGDPNNVTIFGQSAGAWSTCVHLVSPGSRGLFARAIMLSGACSNALYFTPQEAEAQGDQLAAKVGCDGAGRLACLRNKSSEELIRALPFRRGYVLRPGVWWGPVVDGVELPAQPMDRLRSRDFARVPLIVGAAAAEGVIHTASFDRVTPEELEWFVRGVFGDRAARLVLDKYVRATPKESLSDVIGDGIFVCQARRIARAFAVAGVPAYLYHFTHALEDPRVHALGATHSVDLFFLFGNRSLGYGLAASERPLSTTMMDAWGAFARAGDPATHETPWPRYTVERDQHLNLDVRSSIGAHLKSDVCDFWDSIDQR